MNSAVMDDARAEDPTEGEALAVSDDYLTRNAAAACRGALVPLNALSTTFYHIYYCYNLNSFLFPCSLSLPLSPPAFRYLHVLHLLSHLCGCGASGSGENRGRSRI